jgi:hypothetical protein
MCRTKELGGRRCPQHTDPVKHAAYNARRRELYAANKKPKADALPTQFPVLDALRVYPGTDEYNAYHASAVELAKKYIPGYDETRASSEYYSADIGTDEYSPLNAVMLYTSHLHRFIKAFLHGENPEDSKFDFFDKPAAWYKQNIDALDEFISNADEPNEPRMLYRGLKLPQMESGEVDSYLEEHFPVGGVISQKNYMSTSLNADVGYGGFSDAVDKEKFAVDPKRSIVFEIVSKQGAPLTYGTSTYGEDETEVLMPRDAKFKVLSVHKEQPVTYYGNPRFSAFTEQQTTKTIIRLVDAEGDEN